MMSPLPPRLDVSMVERQPLMSLPSLIDPNGLDVEEVLKMYPIVQTNDNSSWKAITPREYGYAECFIEETLPPNAVVGMLDMDAFEVQIYLKKELGVVKGRETYLTTPTILADPSTDRIIAVNFLAKAKGISRQDRVGSAKEKCPEIFIIRKKVRFDKPENINLRHSSWEVLDTILKFREEKQMKFIVEYASNDEFYLDLTRDVDCVMTSEKRLESVNEEQIGKRTYMENTSAVSESSEIIAKFHQLRLGKEEGESQTMLRLIMGCTILEDIRNYVFEHTNFEGAGGIAVNKLLAKLATPLHKPGGITILPQSGLLRVSANIPVEKLPSLGGERGIKLQASLRSVEEGNIQNGDNSEPVVGVTVKDLATLPFSKLLVTTAQGISLGEMLVLRKLAQGVSSDAVVEKLMKMTASVGRGNLRGLRFHHSQKIHAVIYILVAELMERLAEEEGRHKRIPETVQANLHYITFPRKEEDRGTPPTAANFEYLFDPGVLELPLTGPQSNQDLVNAVLKDVLQTLKGESGVIVKINFVIKAFRGVQGRM